MRKQILALGLVMIMVVTGIAWPDLVRAEGMSDYLASGACGESITWTLEDNGRLMVNGTGVLDVTKITWDEYKEEIKSVVIGEGITELGPLTFGHLGSLEEVTFPETLTVIGDYAFMCANLKEVEFPDGLKEIGQYAFAKNQSYLDYILLPEGLEKIGKDGFYGCRTGFISVPSSVTEIGEYAFEEIRLIHCEKDSYAQAYAEEYEYPYEIVEHAGKSEVKKVKYFYNAELEADTYFYDGTEKRPAVTITDGNYTLVQDVDYTVAYYNNIEVGTACVEIKGIGDYVGDVRKVFKIKLRHPASSVEIPSGTPEPQALEFGTGTNIPSRIVLYSLDSKWSQYISIPENFPKSYQLNLDGGAISVVSGENLEVSSSGWIAPKMTLWYWNNSVGSTQSSGAADEKITEQYEAGESIIRLKKGNATYDICVEVVDYAQYYAQYIMEQYLEKNITSSMSEYEKLEVICAFVAAFDYSVNFSSYTGLIVTGGGDCYASTNTIVYMCRKIGMDANPRYGVNDPGAGGGHQNAAVVIDGEVYIADAGYVAKAPRSYHILKEEQGCFYVATDADSVKLVQYDGEKGDVILPSQTNEKAVTSIGVGAFYYGNGHSLIRSVTIPESVKQIGEVAFYYCPQLQEIKVDEGNEFFSSQEGVLFDKAKERLITYPAGKTGDYTIPSTVKTIDSYAMAAVGEMNFLMIPESVTAVENQAFYEGKIKNICFYGNAPKLDGNIFQGITANVYYPQNNATWTEDVRQNYGGTITWKAWEPGKLPVIPEEDGKGSNGGENQEANNNDSGEESQNGSGTSSDSKKNQEQFPIGKSIKIGKYVYKITGKNEVSFKSVSAGTAKSVSVPKTVKYKGRTFKVTAISASAFKNSKVTSVAVGNNVKTIGKSAFEGCSKLQKVTIGSSVTKIESNGFKSCKNLKTVTVKSTKLKTVGKNAFKGIKENATIKVPKQKVNSYKKLLKGKGLGKKVKIIK